MKIEEINIETATEEELINAINSNNRTVDMMTNEINRIRKISKEKQEEMNIDVVESPEVIYKKEPIKKEDKFNDELDYYYSEIKTITSEKEIKEVIEENLPSKNNPNYKKITIAIKANLLKNIKEIKELLITENLSIPDLREFKKELKLNEQIIKEINRIENKKEKVNKQEETKNNLIFVQTGNGNARVIDELSNISEEYYEGFAGLFESIIDGTFKNVKRFKNTNSKLCGVSEVKDFKIRVIFDRVGPHDYAVITAFVKKTDNDKAYQEQLRDKTYKYHNKEEAIKECVKKEDFMKEQVLLQTELFNILKGAKDTNKELKKGTIK